MKEPQVDPKPRRKKAASYFSQQRPWNADNSPYHDKANEWSPDPESRVTMRESLRYQEVHAKQFNCGVIIKISLVIERKDTFSNTV